MTTTTTTTTTAPTKAETRAAATAERLAAAGYDVTVTVSETEPALYLDGSLMYSGRRTATVWATEPGTYWGDSLYLSWSTALQGRRTTRTGYCARGYSIGKPRVLTPRDAGWTVADWARRTVGEPTTVTTVIEPPTAR